MHSKGLAKLRRRGRSRWRRGAGRRRGRGRLCLTLRVEGRNLFGAHGRQRRRFRREVGLVSVRERGRQDPRADVLRARQTAAEERWDLHSEASPLGPGVVGLGLLLLLLLLLPLKGGVVLLELVTLGPRRRTHLLLLVLRVDLLLRVRLLLSVRVLLRVRLLLRIRLLLSWVVLRLVYRRRRLLQLRKPLLVALVELRGRERELFGSEGREVLRVLLRRADERVLLLRRRGRPLVLAAAEEDAAAPPAPPVEELEEALNRVAEQDRAQEEELRLSS